MLKPSRPFPNAINPDDSFGIWLRRQREIREIGLREIADSTKISLRYLEALEQDRFEVLPAPVFAKGFLREYASFVGLDTDEVVNYYLAAVAGEAGETEVDQVPEAPPVPSPPWALILTGLAIVVFAAVGGLNWYLDRSQDDAASVPPMAPPARQSALGGEALSGEATATAANATTGAAAEPADVAAPLPIAVTVDFTQSCWVEAYVDGERVRSELRVQGESLRFEAQNEVRLALQNLAGAAVEINGVAYRPPVKNGEEFIVNRELLSQLEQAAVRAPDGPS